MSDKLTPTLGQWYHNMDTTQTWCIVALDDDAIEIQHFDGEVEELEMEAWEQMALEEIEQPEDWTGPFDDLERDDLGDTESTMRPEGWPESLDELD